MSDDVKAHARARLTEGPQPGEVYSHYKGGIYTVMCRAVQEDTLEPLVIYCSNKYPGQFMARTLGNWREFVQAPEQPHDGRVAITPRFWRVVE